MNLINEETTQSVELEFAMINRRLAKPVGWLLLMFFGMCFIAVCTIPTRAQAVGADNSRRYEQNAYLESHVAFTTAAANYSCSIYCKQDRSIDDQLDAGVRSLDLRLWKVR